MTGFNAVLQRAAKGWRQPFITLLEQAGGEGGQRGQDTGVGGGESCQVDSLLAGFTPHT